MILLLAGTSIFLINNKNKELASVQDIQTDVEFENVTYDKAENIWDDSVLGIITIEEIGLNATVK